MGADSKLLMVVLDAAEPARVESLLDAGKLPTLAELRQTGGYRRVASTTDWWVASPWPSFYTGTPPSRHGFYYYLWWDPETLVSSRPDRHRFDAEPFWRSALPEDARSIVIDGSEMHRPASGDNIELSGWRTHDILSEPWVYPSSLGEELARKGLRPAPLVESYAPLRQDDIRKAQADSNEATESVGQLARLLLPRETWDFALVSLTAPHMAGHQLWSATSLAPDAEPGCASLQRAALDDIYMNCDRVLAEVLEAGHDASNVIVCSLHGMEHNRNRGNVLQEMLDVILGEQRSALHGDTGVIGRVRELLPESIRHAVKSRLPMQWQDRLTGYWRTGGYDWSSTKAFSFVPDLQGYVRVNLAGREKLGIVPAEEYEDVCRAVCEGVMQFHDADDGEPIVEEARPLDLFEPREALRAFMPDVAINWADSPAAKHTSISGPNGASIPWPLPGRNSDGRSGNHTAHGFLVGSGPAFDGGELDAWNHILDFADNISRLVRG